MRLASLVLLAASSVASLRSATVHATLVSSEPAANSHLATSPSRVRLVFSEPVEGKLGRISLRPETGDVFALRAVADPRDVHAVIAPVDSLAPGSYRVEWRVVSADGHPVDGSFVFTIGDTTLGTAAGPPPAAPEPEPTAEDEPDVWGPSVAGAPLIPALLRGAALGALMAAAGLLLFQTGSVPNAPQRSDPRVRRLTTLFAVLGPLLLAAHMTTWIINTSPDHTLDASWASSALGTIVGRIELWRTVLAVLALWAWWLARRPAIALTFGAAALALSGASGHSAAIQPEWGVPAKAIHLLASAVWLGGLLWLIVRPTDDDQALFARDADRVSSRALIAVIAVAFTGVVQTRLFLPSWGDLLTSTYGQLALAKAAGMLVLVGFGAYHRQRLMPRVAAAARSVADIAALRGSVAREIVVMVLVIMLGGLLAYVPPPGEGEEHMSSHQTTS